MEICELDWMAHFEWPYILPISVQCGSAYFFLLVLMTFININKKITQKETTEWTLNSLKIYNNYQLNLINIRNIISISTQKCHKHATNVFASVRQNPTKCKCLQVNREKITPFWLYGSRSITNANESRKKNV